MEFYVTTELVYSDACEDCFDVVAAQTKKSQTKKQLAQAKRSAKKMLAQTNSRSKMYGEEEGIIEVDPHGEVSPEDEYWGAEDEYWTEEDDWYFGEDNGEWVWDEDLQEWVWEDYTGDWVWDE
jgi:hypothetical protein